MISLSDYFESMKSWWERSTGYDLTLISKVEKRNEEIAKGPRTNR